MEYIYSGLWEKEPIREIRYYMGRHKIGILYKWGKKAIIRHLEDGTVGNKEDGYKKVSLGDYDSVLIRTCYKKKRGIT